MSEEEEEAIDNMDFLFVSKCAKSVTLWWLSSNLEEQNEQNRMVMHVCSPTMSTLIFIALDYNTG